MTYTETVNCSFMSQTQSFFAQEACVFRLSINMSNGWIFFKEKEKLKCGRAKHYIPFCVPWHDGEDRRMPELSYFFYFSVIHVF